MLVTLISRLSVPGFTGADLNLWSNATSFGILWYSAVTKGDFCGWLCLKEIQLFSVNQRKPSALDRTLLKYNLQGKGYTIVWYNYRYYIRRL